MNAREITTQISKAADFLNLKKWDYGASFSNDYSVQVDKGEAKQLKASQKQVLTIRVWNKSNLVGITTTSDVSESGIKKALNKANIASDFGNKNESTEFSPLARDPINTKEVRKRNPVGIQKLLILLREAELKLIESHESIKSIPYNGLSESFFERVYANSDGAFRSYSNSHAALYLYARAEEKDKKPRSSGAVKLGYGVEDIDIESCIKEASNKTISHLNYSSIKTDKYLICFSPESFLTIINAFSSMFNARSILDGVSLSNKNSIGERISTEALNIYDDGLHEKNISSAPFDGEGTPTKRLCLINKGKIENFLHSESTARIFKTIPTGHAGLGSKVSVSPDWIVVEKSKGNYDLKTSLDHSNYDGEFVYIEELNAIHAGVRASQGSFSLPFDGWLYKNGNKVSIESATVAGDIKYLLKNIINIESNQELTTSGISPHVWVHELSITGDS
ncbi:MULTISPECIES: TldD/PmbA family protein [Prochlorococcus]|uniref:TldE/PmbA protein n=1 Tax=Prochlorococcus marinus str. MIT 9116 TaxID=167544 RepID=A0A0A1ZM18_PROMR|nr:TldD/PmbA family protein [Prochlorococcus marinus]KGF89521.1 TldE/PmbA protein [Prochlorococcus marinus str. MIT 9107]KGF90470.1 TldE/PmbA protein [Prochlorococcus marinus str. MIT 9116]KGF92949.1 TldE/PmbA protein [Prochlorococcus marinus str. MIT 9123]